MLNRSNAFTGISVEDAESALKREFETKITNEYRVAICALEHAARRSCSRRPDSLLGRSIVEFAQVVDKRPVAPRRPSPSLSRVPAPGRPVMSG